MLALDRASGKFSDRTIKELPEFLSAGDLLVFNDTRVIPARLMGMKASGGRVEIFLERVLVGNQALAQLRASKPIKEESGIATPGGVVRVIARSGEMWRLEFPEEPLAFLEKHGDVPLPPYIQRVADEEDKERYQSIFAHKQGAVAAPTASLHFDEELMEAMEARGVRHAFVTLHVGAGTFQPLRAENIAEHRMHSERISVDSETCEAIARTRAEGRRVVAVGTTVARTLEAVALKGEGVVKPFRGETNLFITPGFEFKMVDALLTNFHLPQSTLLMLVAAFAGREQVLAAYGHAVKEKYRFFSYGDAMFIAAGAA